MAATKIHIMATRCLGQVTSVVLGRKFTLLVGRVVTTRLALSFSVTKTYIAHVNTIWGQQRIMFMSLNLFIKYVQGNNKMSVSKDNLQVISKIKNNSLHDICNCFFEIRGTGCSADHGKKLGIN